MSGEGEQDFGTESFLDVITNSIGILIILVLVTGARATQKVETAPPPENVELTAAQAEEQTLDGDVRHIAAQMETVQAELARRTAERNDISTMVRAIEDELAKRRAALDEQSRGRYDVDRDLALARKELEQLERERAETEQSKAPETIKIESYPTPLSKTVDEKEAHFQLVGGKLTYIPFETLVDRLKTVLRDYMSRLHDQGELSDTLGPIGGFHLRYNIERFDTPRGSYMQVSYIEFVPTSRQLGETLDDALQAKSNFRNKLEMMSPRQYTITVWTYPDSFADFRRLKKELYQMGYAVAARPLPDGMPIGASPQGSKSSAQ